MQWQRCWSRREPRGCLPSGRRQRLHPVKEGSDPAVGPKPQEKRGALRGSGHDVGLSQNPQIWGPQQTTAGRGRRLGRAREGNAELRQVRREAAARNPRPLGSAADSARAPRLTMGSHTAGTVPSTLRLGAKAVFVQAETCPASQGVGDLRGRSGGARSDADSNSHLDPKALKHALPLLSGLGLFCSLIPGKPIGLSPTSVAPGGSV